MDKVKQVIIKDKDGVLLMVARYDVKKRLFYTQNRSHDLSMGLDDFLDRLKASKERAKKEGLIIEEGHVIDGDKWPVK